MVHERKDHESRRALVRALTSKEAGFYSRINLRERKIDDARSQLVYWNIFFFFFFFTSSRSRYLCWFFFYNVVNANAALPSPWRGQKRMLNSDASMTATRSLLSSSSWISFLNYSEVTRELCKRCDRRFFFFAEIDNINILFGLKKKKNLSFSFD